MYMYSWDSPLILEGALSRMMSTASGFTAIKHTGSCRNTTLETDRREDIVNRTTLIASIYRYVFPILASYHTMGRYSIHVHRFATKQSRPIASRRLLLLRHLFKVALHQIRDVIVVIFLIAFWDSLGAQATSSGHVL